MDNLLTLIVLWSMVISVSSCILLGAVAPRVIEEQKARQEKLCRESNCCYDPSWDKVVCKDWQEQVDM